MKMKLPEPFLGRLLLEAVKETANTYLTEKVEHKMGDYFKDKGFEVVAATTVVDEATGEKKTKIDSRSQVPVMKGKILAKAPDAFGKVFIEAYGEMPYYPQIGDVVMFIANQQYNVDPDGQYCMISDNHVIGICERHKITKEVKVHE